MAIAKITFQIKSRWTDSILFEGEYESLKKCVEDANLGGADLEDANLGRADLGGADLEDANLWGADLGGADLEGVNLGRANLWGADLGGVNLGRANLRGADLGDAELGFFKTDLIAEVLKLPDELENLRDTLKAGKIDGSTYTGECACLAGTIAKNRGVNISSGGNIQVNGVAFKADSSSPREQFFMAIREGDTPENNGAAKMALEWIEEAICIRDHIRKTA
jgi:hypothetical protein